MTSEKGSKVQRYIGASRYLYGILFLFALSSLLFATRVHAHVLKTDGNIGAILHVNPDDDPIVGKPSSFFFELKDKTGMFKQSNCICIVTITRQKRVESTQSIESNQTEVTNLVSTYTFPQKDVYTITLSGKPNQTNDFTPFELHYDIRISREESKNTTTFTKNPILHNIHYGLFAIGFILLILLVRKEKKKNN